MAHSGGFCNPACTGEIFNVARKLDSGSVDLIVSGHTHSEINTSVNGIRIVQARSHGTNLAVVDWVRRADGRNELQPRILTVWTDSIRPDTVLARAMERHAVRVRQIAARPVAQLKFPLPKKTGDYPLGHLIADAVRVAARSDVGLMNNGGIRASLPQGPVTYGQVYQVQPFDHQIVKLTVTGDSLLQALELVVRGAQPDANVSGVEIWYDPGREPGKRIRRARLLDGREIEKGKSYTLAVPDFLAVGGSGFSMLKASPLERTSQSDIEALINYLRRLPAPVDIPDAPRFHAEQ